MQPMLNMALRAAREAGELIVRASERFDVLKVDQKGVNDFVTDVDKAAEKTIIYTLKKAYPDHNFLGEESGSQQGQNDGAEYTWIIDPLDGTTNFIHDIPHYSISIACQHKGRIEHAVVLDPIRQEEFTASRGAGAQLNGKRIRVSDQKGFPNALFGTGIPYKPSQQQYMDAYLEIFKEFAMQTAGVRRAGSAALDLAYVAAGRFDAFWEIGLDQWDIAAGSLLVQEAGGLVSDFSGGSNYLESGNIVCANPKLFKLMLQTMQPHLPDSLKR